MIQIPEIIEQPKQNRFGQTFNTIAESGQERIRKAGAKILIDNPKLKGRIDVGFKVFNLSETNFPQWNEDITSEKINEQLNFLSGEVKNEEDAIYEILLLVKDYLLDEEVQVVYPHLYSLGDTKKSLVSVSEMISDEIITWITQHKEEYDSVIIYDNSLNQEQKFNLIGNLGEKLEII